MQINKQIEISNPTALFGVDNANLDRISSLFHVEIGQRGNEIFYSDDNERQVKKVDLLFDELISHLEKTGDLEEDDFETYLKLHYTDDTEVKKFSDMKYSETIINSHTGQIRPKTENQAKLVQAIVKNDVVFGIGPAGTGKTYLSVAMAVSMLRQGFIKKIVLVRPIVQAGEDLGYLPGDFKMKVNPYLRPLLDALEDFYEKEQLKHLLEMETIEIAPLAYMRGRTLNNAFIILDEAQNTTNSQMKMFLTRFGQHSKVVVNGDITQIDLPKSTMSGLITVKDILKNIKGIEFCRFTKADVVRHRLVQQIINAYEKKKI